MENLRITIVGATGVVGRELLRNLKQRSFPMETPHVCASERSWGDTLEFNNRELIIEEATSDLFQASDLVFIAAGSNTSSVLAPLAVKNNAVVVDKSSSFRMDPKVPLVIPEINSDDLNDHNGIIASPNCSTTPLAMILNSLRTIESIDRVIVDTYQSVSGAGKKAMAELHTQSVNVLDRKNPKVRSVESTSNLIPNQIAFNVVPQVEHFLENGYTTEEIKMVNETKKILHEPNLALSATCVRVPVNIGHSEAVHIEFANRVTVDDAKDVFSDAPGIRLVDDPTSETYPMPIDVAGQDDVLVGRIRLDMSNPRGLVLWLSSDNLRKGAALNSVQIAEELIARELLS